METIFFLLFFFFWTLLSWIDIGILFLFLFNIFDTSTLHGFHPSTFFSSPNIMPAQYVAVSKMVDAGAGAAHFFPVSAQPYNNVGITMGSRRRGEEEAAKKKLF